MQNTLNTILNFIPFNEQEEADKQFALETLKNFPNSLTRENVYTHFTASAIILNSDHTKILCCFHNIYKAWSIVGGHMDGLDNPMQVAIKEAKEETGIKTLTPLSSTAFAMDVLPTAGHFKNNKYVCCHSHINFWFLFEGDENEPLKSLPTENTAVGWIDLEEIIKKSPEPYMHDVYRKIIYKVKNKIYF